ncbi:hypothetical protein DGG96_16705 [Legionella qingyii]|uniref:Uncharacterized protein n=1 Tax=Legionella qingyii TaxID=2184757 RepID=A0A317U1C0_9GAMM|nr:hypothetical protein DGG96_16705 [Legionella qingyii]
MFRDFSVVGDDSDDGFFKEVDNFFEEADVFFLAVAEFFEVVVIYFIHFFSYDSSVHSVEDRIFVLSFDFRVEVLVDIMGFLGTEFYAVSRYIIDFFYTGSIYWTDFFR